MSLYYRTVTNVLTAKECEEWIAFAEKQGFAAASAHNPHRTNDRALVVSTAKAQLLTDRLRTHLLPKSPDGKYQMTGLNDHMSFLRYRDGQMYGKHTDVPYESENGRVRSFYTCQLYLNEGFKGGETRLYPHLPTSFEPVDVVPSRGSVLLFDQNLVHMACGVTEGTKYSVRIDVLYAH